jgi:hypothetical protein
VAALCTRVKVTWKDRYGQQASVVFHVAAGIVNPDNVGVQAIIVALEAAMRAKALKIELSQVNAVTGSATSGVNYVMQDKALFRFTDQDGQAHNWKIPGPGSGIFSTDDETVLPADSDVAAYISAVTTHAKGRGGANITTFTSGYRTTSRKRLKR